jgi:serine/threonine-protein kinase
MRSLQLHDPLGVGAFGTVYRGVLSSGQGMRRPVAVKVLGNTDNAEFLARLRDEARLLGLLQDAHILAVLDLARVDGRDAVVMEWVDGVDLLRLLQAGWVPPLRALSGLGASVAGALDRAHSAVDPSTGQPLRVVHRDVKPANIMLTTRGHIKLLDFGVAKAAFEARESRTGRMVLGTLQYMAPEYLLSGDVSPAADVYGLGLVLGELATGTPFGKPRVRQHQFEDWREDWLSRVPEDYRDLTPILRAALAWSPADRPSAATLEAWLIELTDEGSGQGLRSWAGRAVAAVRADQGPVEDPLGLGGRTFDLDGAGPGPDLTVPMHAPAAPAGPTPSPRPPRTPTPPSNEPTQWEPTPPPAEPDTPALSMMLTGLLIGGGVGVVLLGLVVVFLWVFR